MMNLHELTVSCLKLIQENTYQIDRIIIVDNGSEQELLAYEGMQQLDSSLINKLTVIRNPENIGVKDALQQIYKASNDDVILYTHNDVLFLEKDWDIKVREAFKNNPETGVIGCFGSKGLGSMDIYKIPYEMSQLARWGNVSDSSMEKDVHNFRGMGTEKENVATFDGFCLIVKKELLDKINGFDTDVLTYHHMYDQYICVESLKNGYENIVIPLDLYHRGGQTDSKQDWTKNMGMTKQEVHQKAHPLFYEYGKGVLPIWIDDIYDEQSGLICGYDLYMDNKLVKERIYA